MNGYLDWAYYHGRLFGHTGEQQSKTIEAWEQVFDLEGFTEPELRAATLRLARDGAPAFFGDHLKALQEAVRQARAKDQAARDRATPASAPEPCRLCDGGLVVWVPDHRDVADGQWQARPGRGHHEIPVVCNCPAGRALTTRLRLHWSDRPCDAGKRGNCAACKGGPQMSLDDYEFRVPHWRDLVAWRRELRQAQTKAAGVARSLGVERLPGLLGDLARRMRA